MFLDPKRMPRSQRVVIEIPVRVRVNRGRATPVEEITKTVIVNANGAVTKLSLVVAGQTLQMVNLRTNAEVKCTVADTRMDPKDSEKAEVGIPLMKPRPATGDFRFPRWIKT
jgi:hypothetical protein